MIGVIISGHGMFATGISSSVKLIGGEFPHVCYVDFLETDSIEQLKDKYRTALKSLNECKNILGLADLVGGSPFKTLVELSTEIDREMQVVGGISVPVALDALMNRDITDNLNELIDMAIESGRENMLKFEVVKKEQQNFDDGI